MMTTEEFINSLMEKGVDYISSGEVYINPETAMLLKKAGFGNNCRAAYKKTDDEKYERVFSSEPKNWREEGENYYPCISQSYAIYWIKEVYKYHIYSEFDGEAQTFSFCVNNLAKDPDDSNFFFDSYDCEDPDEGIEASYRDPEDAIEVAIRKVLEIAIYKNEHDAW